MKKKSLIDYKAWQGAPWNLFIGYRI